MWPTIKRTSLIALISYHNSQIIKLRETNSSQLKEKNKHNKEFKANNIKNLKNQGSRLNISCVGMKMKHFI